MPVPAAVAVGTNFLVTDGQALLRPRPGAAGRFLLSEAESEFVGEEEGRQELFPGGICPWDQPYPARHVPLSARRPICLCPLAGDHPRIFCLIPGLAATPRGGQGSPAPRGAPTAAEQLTEPGGESGYLCQSPGDGHQGKQILPAGHSGFFFLPFLFFFFKFFSQRQKKTKKNRFQFPKKLIIVLGESSVNLMPRGLWKGRGRRGSQPREGLGCPGSVSACAAPGTAGSAHGLGSRPR